MPAAAQNVHVGIAGWSYPDWRGSFYPERGGRGRELSLVAALFDCAEINVSFYRPPEAHMAEGWLRAVEGQPAFRFTSKVPKELTHERALPAEALRSGAARLVEGLRPLSEAGRLAALLLQFPFYFRDGPESRERIARLVEAFRPLPCVVELRDRGFFFGGRRSTMDPVHSPEDGESEKPAAPQPLATGPGSAIRFLEELGAGLANIDLPQGRDSVPPTSVNTSPLGYVRLHGQNRKAWFDPGAGRDQKYSYLYSAAELRGWVERALRLAARTEATFVIANNHYRGQGPATALLFSRLLGRAPRAEPPAELLAAFPSLSAALRGEVAP